MANKPETEQTLPANIDAERTILGAILLDVRVCNEAATLLTSADFHLDSHRRIYQAMLELNRDNRAIDIVTIDNQLGVQDSKAVGGVAYISSLIDGVPHQPSVAEYARIITEKSRLRGLINAASLAQTKALDGDDSHEVIGELEAKLSDLLQRRSKVKTLAEVGVGFVKHIYETRSLDRDTIGMSYTIGKLDDMTTGIRAGDYTLIAGRPRIGKSALARQIAADAARNGISVLVFTPEMTAEQFLSMLAPMETGIDFYKIRNPRLLSPEELKRVTDGIDRIIQWPLLVDDTTAIDIAELTAKARLHIANGVQLIVVDYLQLLTAAAKDERQRINLISAGLRDLAKSTQIPVIALSQLTRPEGRNDNEKPTIFHLKESGNLEQDALNIFLLYRPMEGDAFTGKDRVIIAKQRFGESGTWVPVQFQKSTVSYRERLMEAGER